MEKFTQELATTLKQFEDEVRKLGPGANHVLKKIDTMKQTLSEIRAHGESSNGEGVQSDQIFCGGLPGNQT